MNILITGGTKGVGKAIAERFARQDNNIFINYHADDKAAQDTLQNIKNNGGNAILLKMDIGSAVSCRDLIQVTKKHVETLDLLVHCAVRSITKPTLELKPEEFLSCVELNGNALLYLTQSALPMLHRGSSIIFLTSKGSVAAVPNYAALGAPKALAEALVRYLAVELAPRGVRVNSISGGPMDTEAFRSMFPGDAAKVRLDAAIAANPSGRGMKVEDIADFVEFLVSDKAAMIQGQRIHIDGGLYLR